TKTMLITTSMLSSVCIIRPARYRIMPPPHSLSQWERAGVRVLKAQEKAPHSNPLPLGEGPERIPHHTPATLAGAMYPTTVPVRGTSACASHTPSCGTPCVQESAAILPPAAPLQQSYGQPQ